VELRALFSELWEFAQVLTADKLKTFTETYHRVKHLAPAPMADRSAVGRAEPSTSRRKQDQEVRTYFSGTVVPSGLRTVSSIVQRGDEAPRREQVPPARTRDLGAANETNRFLNWVRLTYAPGRKRGSCAQANSRRASRRNPPSRSRVDENGPRQNPYRLHRLASPSSGDI